MTNPYVPKAGDRVRVVERHESDRGKEWCAPGVELTVSASSEPSSGEISGAGFFTIWIDGRGMGAYLRVEPISAQPEASGERLFESGCYLCGSDEHTIALRDECRANVGALVCAACWERYGRDHRNTDAEITRRKSLAQPAPVAFYGTMPSVLPETLPAGTVFYSHDWTWRLRSPAVRDREYPLRKTWRITGEYERIKPDHELLHPDLGAGTHVDLTTILGIDWSTVPIQSPATPPATSAPPPGCLGQTAKIDPYRAHQYKLEDMCRTSSALELWMNDQDKRHADRQAQALAQLNKPIRTGPLKNRDRYGQLLSARGWETEETDP